MCVGLVVEYCASVVVWLVLLWRSLVVALPFAFVLCVVVLVICVSCWFSFTFRSVLFSLGV